jgi:serine/threonine-protein kinase RsbW
MAADPGGSSTARHRRGTAIEPRRRGLVVEDRWRGPGWRVFDSSASQVSQVRDWITTVVASHGGPADPADAALVVSEMFTNSVIHGPAGGRVLVGYCLWPGGAGIVVCDAGGPATPRLRDPGDQEEGGRGLQVVDAVAAAWGSFRVDRALAVWCDLGKPLDLPASQAWAWLRPVLAAGALVTTETQSTSAGDWRPRESSRCCVSLALV